MAMIEHMNMMKELPNNTTSTTTTRLWTILKFYSADHPLHNVTSHASFVLYHVYVNTLNMVWYLLVFVFGPDSSLTNADMPANIKQTSSCSSQHWQGITPLLCMSNTKSWKTALQRWSPDQWYHDWCLSEHVVHRNRMSLRTGGLIAL